MVGRFLVLLLCMAGVAMTAGVAMAQSSDDLFAQVFGNTAAAEPKGVALPVSADGRDAGDVGALVDLSAGTARVKAADLVDVLYRFVEPSAAQALIDGADAEGYVDEAAIAATGLQSVFDPGNLRLLITVPPDLRPLQDLSLRGDYRTGEADVPVLPADVSAYLNLFTGLDFQHTDSSNSPGGTGRQPIQTAFEGVIDVHGAVVHADLFYQEDADRPWQRGDVRAIFDNQEAALRTTVGDLDYPTAGFQNFVSMGGASVVRRFAIQPYRTTQPSGSRDFLLESDSQVNVIVNGREVDSFDLPAGPYSLSDFPISSGANDVVLEIRDNFGRVDEIAFSQYYDGSLLEPGLTEYALALGAPSSRQDGLYRYDDSQTSFSGFYREGLTDTLTLGGNLQGSTQVAMAGGEVRMATPLGNILIEPAASWASGFGLDGALNLQNELYQTLGERFPGERLWNFNVTFRGPDFAQLGIARPFNPVSLQLGARMSQLLDENHSISVGARYGLSRDSAREDTNNFSVLLRRRLWAGASADVTLERDTDTSGQTETSLLFTVRIPLGESQTFRASLDTSDQGWELRWSDRPANPINAIASDIALDRNTDSQGMTADFDYRNQRFDASLRYDLDNPRKDTGTHRRVTEFDLGTALVFADGHVAMSRPVSDSFAIVVPHENLSGYDIGLNPSQGTYLAEVDWMGPAVLPDLGSYEYNTVIVEVPELPFGYDLGDETPTVLPTLTSGSVIVVGTDATVLLGGTLVDNIDQPLALQAGEIRRADEPDAEPTPFFTNRAGKFRIDGARPGDYILRLYALPGLEIAVAIPPEAEGLYDVGTLVVPET